MPLVDGWMVGSPMWNWILPFFTPIFFFLILIAPCLINFLLRFFNSRFKRFLTRLLISCYYRIISPWLQNQKLVNPNYSQIVKVKLAPRTLMPPNSRKYSDNNFPPFLILDDLSMANQSGEMYRELWSLLGLDVLRVMC